MEIKDNAYAKLNLTLDILRKRPDGYHDMRMVMQSIELYDEISIKTKECKEISLDVDLSFLPKDETNIAVKAAKIFFRETEIEPRGLHIDIHKQIPVCAGMAGGSTDGAAVLRCLRRAFCPDMPQAELERIGALVGSDVPFCVRGGTALAEGRGEILSDLPPMPPCWIVVSKPGFPISTPELFRAVRVKDLRCRPDTAGMISALERGDLLGIAHRLYNVFEDVLPRRCHEVGEIKGAMLDMGALGTAMTGSGPTVFGLFAEQDRALEAATALRKQYRDTFVARPV